MKTGPIKNKNLTKNKNQFSLLAVKTKIFEEFEEEEEAVFLYILHHHLTYTMGIHSRQDYLFYLINFSLSLGGKGRGAH